MPCGERPLARTTADPASSTRCTASYTGAEISSYVVPTPSTHFSRVPSMSRATSFGRHPASVEGRSSVEPVGTNPEPLGRDGLEHVEAPEVGPERLGHPNRAVLLLV